MRRLETLTIVHSNPFSNLYTSILCVIIPLLFAIHNIISSCFLFRSEIITYCLKIAPAVAFTLFVIYFRIGIDWFLVKRMFWIFIFAGFFIAFGLIMPLFSDKKLNLFYYFGDALGILTLLVYFYYTLFFLVKGFISVDTLYKILNKALLIIILLIIAKYTLTNGEKISLPSEIHYNIAIYFSLFVTSSFYLNIKRLCVTLSIVLGVFLSIFRINIFILVLSTIASIIRAFFTLKPKNNFFNGLILISTIAIFFFTPISRSLDIQLKKIPEYVYNKQLQLPVFKDISINQRIVETTLINKEMANGNSLNYLMGMGFGALYYNERKAISYYPEQQHHAHITPIVIFFRNGIFGLVLFLIPFLYATVTLFSKNKAIFVASVGVFFTYLALLTDQYVYWGIYYGLSLSIWFFEIKLNPIGKSKIVVSSTKPL